MALHDPDPMTLSCRRACAVDLNCHLAPCSTAQPISLAFDHVFFTASPARPRGHHSRRRSCGSFGALDGCICSGMGESCAAGALGDMSTPRVLAAAEPARSKTIAARVTAISQVYALPGQLQLVRTVRRLLTTVQDSTDRELWSTRSHARPGTRHAQRARRPHEPMQSARARDVYCRYSIKTGILGQSEAKVT